MLRLIFKNWNQFAEFMNELDLREGELDMKFEARDGLVVYWENPPNHIPHEVLMNFTEFFEMN